MLNGCDLISVDSAMVYKYMNIGTAKPDSETLKKYPHELVDIKDPEEIYSVGDFYRDTHKLIQKSLDNNKIPILVGGTMMYYNALFKGLSNLPGKDDNIREKIESDAQKHGWKKLHQDLAKIDPKAIQKIHANDTQRITRALEIYEITGKPISSFWEQDLNNNKNNWEYILIGLSLDRSLLHKRIEQRFDKILSSGFLDEVKDLMQRKDLTPEHPSMKSVGYRQAWQYLESVNNLDNISLDMMREKAIIATRRLAKHQCTWLNNGLNNGLNNNISSKIFSADQPEDKLLSKVIEFLLQENIIN
jgi:tRNA dimethylallyltransferase